jgi:hypothetical protein
LKRLFSWGESRTLGPGHGLLLNANTERE